MLTTLTTFITSYSMGDEINQTDIINAILNVPGVEDIKIPFEIFALQTGTAIPTGVSDIQLESKQYVTLGTLDLKVSYEIVEN